MIANASKKLPATQHAFLPCRLGGTNGRIGVPALIKIKGPVPSRDCIPPVDRPLRLSRLDFAARLRGKQYPAIMDQGLKAVRGDVQGRDIERVFFSCRRLRALRLKDLVDLALDIGQVRLGLRRPDAASKGIERIQRRLVLARIRRREGISRPRPARRQGRRRSSAPGRWRSPICPENSPACRYRRPRRPDAPEDTHPRSVSAR